MVQVNNLDRYITIDIFQQRKLRELIRIDTAAMLEWICFAKKTICSHLF